MATRTVGLAERTARLGIRHRLAASARTDDVAAITRSLVALHSTDPVSVHLSALARMRKPARPAVESALYDEHSVIRHHAMRRTLWVLTPELARAAHASCTASLAPNEWRRLAKLVEDSGVARDGPRWVEAARRDTLAALEEAGETTARELGRLVPALTAKLQLAVGKPYAGTQGAHTRVLMNLGFDGLIVRGRPTGSWINGEYRWAAMDRWLPGGVVGVDPSTAAAELARAYLRAFGPATTADLQWWAGWTLTTTRRALGAVGAVGVATAEGDAWLLPDDLDVVRAPKPWVAFLPALDPTVMGWKEREWYLGDHGRLGHSMFDRNGNGGPTVWVDGEVVGAWAQRPTGEVAYRLVVDVGRARRDEIEAAAARLQDWIGPAPVKVRFPAPIQAELLASR
jgi:hypothetical protein